VDGHAWKGQPGDLPHQRSIVTEDARHRSEAEAGIESGPREAMQGRQLRQGISRSVAPLNSTRPSRRGSPGGDLILAPEFRRAA
jgi:hypothetical protein